jgi:predicted  nucleic acid-binding Zn-ribbon protein
VVTRKTPAPAAATPRNLEAELQAARVEIRALREELARTAPEMDDLRRQIIAARQQGERYRRQVAALRGSASWRLTKPLRMLRRHEPDAL